MDLCVYSSIVTQYGDWHIQGLYTSDTYGHRTWWSLTAENTIQGRTQTKGKTHNLLAVL